MFKHPSRRYSTSFRWQRTPIHSPAASGPQRSGGRARMKVVVLVKHVPDTAADRHFAADLTLDRDAVAGRLDEPDEYAIEQALRVADRIPEASVTALTMGPAAAVTALRR